MGRINAQDSRGTIKKTMFFDVISSGSKGNATLVFTEENIFLIDLGIASSSLETELALFNKKITDITALFVTHNHTDHIKGLKAISPKKQFALDGTLPSELSNVMEINKPVLFGNDKIIAFPTEHDAINPCGFMIEADGEKLVYMTDTGVYLSINNELVHNPQYLIIESNHDVKMLMNTNRPIELKQRILSEHGHLCNEDSAFAALEIIGKDTKEIVLAHLSEEANTPETALAAYEKVFRFKHVNVQRYKIRCANQWTHLIGGNYED